MDGVDLERFVIICGCFSDVGDGWCGSCSGEELQRCIFDMALPLAVFRSSSLQQMQRKEEEYFEAAQKNTQTLGHKEMKTS